MQQALRSFVWLGFVLVVSPQVMGQEAAPSELVYPLSAAVHESGAIYIADRNLPGVWKLEGGQLSVYFQASKKFRTPLNAVRCVRLDKLGNLLAGDSATREVYRFDKAGQPIPLTNGGIGIPMDLAVDANGDLYVADLELHRIWKVPQAGGEPTKFLEIRAPRGLFVDQENRLWIVAHGDDQLFRATAAGELETVVKGRPFQFPHNVAVDNEGAAYVTDGYAQTVWKIAPGGKPAPLVQGAPLQNPVGLSWKGNSLLAVDPKAKGLFEVTKDGKLTPVWPNAADAKR
jgi:sugar lactone lactonase YvrE